MKKFKYYNRLVLYFEGHLNDNLKRELEEELLSNETLREEYNAFLVSEEASNVLKYSSLFKKVRENPPSTSLRFTYIATRVAAVFVFAMACLLIYSNVFFSNETISKKEFLNVKPTYGKLKGSTNNLDLIDSVRISFQNENWKLFLRINSQIDSLNSNYPESQLLLGCYFLYNQKYSEAIKSFKIASRSQSIYKERSEFILSLAYLSNNNLKKAEETLKRISNEEENHQFSSKAKEVIYQLNSIYRKFIF